MRIINLEQGSDEWLKFRIGKISGTRLSKALGTKTVQDSLINTLIAEELTGESEQFYKSEAMSRGSDMEEYAMYEYCNNLGITAEKVGILQHDTYDWFILSPDRLIKKGKKYQEAIEGKCPNTDTMVRYYLDGNIPKEYQKQVEGYFMINDDLKRLHFVAYDPRIIVPGKEIFSVVVERKDVDVEGNMEKLVKFWERYQVELHKII